MPTGTCLLCRRTADLQFSHVVPAFVFRWLKDTAGGSPIRGGDRPNKKLQDSPRYHWLCFECEQLFGRSEALFAKRVFHPYFANPSQEIRYAKWLLHFCVSLSWRTLQFHLIYPGPAPLAEADYQIAVRAERTWADFLLGRRRRPGEFHQHIIPLDTLARVSGGTAPNLNRYLTRAIDMDLPRGPTMAFTYTKIGRFIVLGFLRCLEFEQWKGSSIDPIQGTIRQRKFLLPQAFFDFVIEKAVSMHAALASVSGRQVTQMRASLLHDAGTFADSDSCKALNADIEMFGDEALVKGRSADGDVKK